jgi:hypothetical protein
MIENSVVSCPPCCVALDVNAPPTLPLWHDRISATTRRRPMGMWITGQDKIVWARDDTAAAEARQYIPSRTWGQSSRSLVQTAGPSRGNPGAQYDSTPSAAAGIPI